MSSIKEKLGCDRESLIGLAVLLGCDYLPKVDNIFFLLGIRLSWKTVCQGRWVHADKTAWQNNAWLLRSSGRKCLVSCCKFYFWRLKDNQNDSWTLIFLKLFSVIPDCCNRGEDKSLIDYIEQRCENLIVGEDGL